MVVVEEEVVVVVVMLCQGMVLCMGGGCEVVNSRLSEELAEREEASESELEVLGTADLDSLHKFPGCLSFNARQLFEHVARHLREYERKAIGFFLACPLSFAPISWLLWYVAQNITYTQDFVTARTTTSVF